MNDGPGVHRGAGPGKTPTAQMPSEDFAPAMIGAYFVISRVMAGVFAVGAKTAGSIVAMVLAVP